MNRTKIKLLLLLFLPIIFLAQENPELERRVLAQDFSSILMAKKIEVFTEKSKSEFFERPEPLGYIGNDFERLFIHFTEIKKDSKNPKLYHAKGKTKVRDVVREFSGSLLIINLNFKKEHDMNAGFMTGTAEFQTNLKERKSESSTGIFNGKLTTRFLINEGKIKYNTLYYYSDGFRNNTFTGTWTSYKTGKSKKVRFGDFRIPDSRDLDIGAGEFSANPKYFEKGWKYYILQFYGETETDTELGRKREAEKWWK